jgi:GNAT superfamily N-acetyltransferase
LARVTSVAKDPGYRIAVARPRDVARLPAIELAAATLLRGYEPDAVLMTTSSLDDFAEAQAAGTLWVARDADEPVGFALVFVIEPGRAHLDELDVHPDHGRRGLGRRLVTTVCEWATRSGLREVTLTTNRDVAWNRPFYESTGFTVLAEEEWSPGVTAVFREEIEHGLDPDKRVVMRYICNCPPDGHAERKGNC